MGIRKVLSTKKPLPKKEKEEENLYTQRPTGQQKSSIQLEHEEHEELVKEVENNILSDIDKAQRKLDSDCEKANPSWEELICVYKLKDGRCIPTDFEFSTYNEYIKWIKGGGPEKNFKKDEEYLAMRTWLTKQ